MRPQQYEANPNMNDPLQLFKREVEARCQRSFQQLRKKNDITKTLIGNLNEGIDRQQHRVELLGVNIKNLQGTVQQDVLEVGGQQHQQLQREVAQVIGEKDRQIAQVVQQIIARLQGFEETIRTLPKPERPNPERLGQLENSLVQLDQQLQTISQRNQGAPQQQPYHYESERDQLFRDMNFLEQILEEQRSEFNETNKLLEKNLEVYRATIEQPINNFDVNMSRQNQENQKILKNKLHGFATRIKKLQGSLQKVAGEVQERKKAIAEGERKLEEGLISLGQNVARLNTDVNGLEKQRMQKIQQNGNFLDQFVDQMLLETAELNKRIDNLKANYQNEINKLRSDFQSKRDDVTSGYSNIIMQQGSGCIVEAAESSHTFKPEKDCEESKGRQSTEETEKSTQRSAQHRVVIKRDRPIKFNILEEEGIETYQVTAGGIFKLQPQLQLHQGIHYPVPTVEVKVKLDDVHENKDLWELVVGYVKRDLLILDGFIYSLERSGTGHFVSSIWSMKGLFRIYYDSDYSKVRMVFNQNNQIKNRDFCTKYKRGFFDRLRAELDKLGRSLN